MEITASSDLSLISLLYNLGIPAEAVFITIDGRLSPETAKAKKGQKIDIVFYKHVPPFYSPSEPRGHWARAE